jgi:hypothetical protein
MVEASGDAGGDLSLRRDGREGMLVLQSDPGGKKAGGSVGFEMGIPRGIPPQILKVNHASRH